MSFENDFSQFNNVIPINRGREIQREKEERTLVIVEGFLQRVEHYNLQNKGSEIKKTWTDDFKRLIEMLYLKPEEINSARVDLITDLLEQAQGTANFFESIHEEERTKVYAEGETILREAFEKYKESSKKM